MAHPYQTFSQNLKDKLLRYFHEILAHIFDIWNPLKSAEKSFFGKDWFNSKFQSKIFGVCDLLGIIDAPFAP